MAGGSAHTTTVQGSAAAAASVGRVRVGWGRDHQGLGGLAHLGPYTANTEQDGPREGAEDGTGSGGVTVYGYSC